MWKQKIRTQKSIYDRMDEVYPSCGLLTSSENDEIELYSLTQMNPRNVTGFMEEYMQYAIVIKLKNKQK